MTAAPRTGAALSETLAARAIARAAATTTPICVGPSASGSSCFAGVWVSALIWSARSPSERRHRRLGPSDADGLSLYEPERVPHLEVDVRGFARLDVELQRRVLREVRVVRLSVAVRVPAVGVSDAGSGADDEVVVAGVHDGGVRVGDGEKPGHHRDPHDH